MLALRAASQAPLSNRLSPVVAPGRGLSSPTQRCRRQKKSLNVSSDSSSKYGGERGIDSRCSPCGQRRRRRCPTGCRRLSNPVGASHPPPQRCRRQKKSLNVSSDSSSKDGGERGIDSRCSPCGQRRRRRCPTGCRRLSNPVGASHPPRSVAAGKKKSERKFRLFFKIWR